ncbi:hypothetical protein [Bradyrhizobium sp. Ec3.3]|uniref:hypothetical protein n=1 Tax=Bradyrhizobium sp. Ec3.3 TaxID=189753 RepID=UPI0012EBA963|nr:hypothetical protein [Bradyrhizobium sp. Ec3.3]
MCAIKPSGFQLPMEGRAKDRIAIVPSIACRFSFRKLTRLQRPTRIERRAAGLPKTKTTIVKFDEQERGALKRAGFSVADDYEAAYLEALVVIGAHDDETLWLTITLPNSTRVVCALPRAETIVAIDENG